MNLTLHNQIQILCVYQAWRTGKDERTLTELGIIPSEITTALDSVLDIAEKYLHDSDDNCCNNPSNCWEPCGDLGNNIEHAKIYTGS